MDDKAILNEPEPTENPNFSYDTPQSTEFGSQFLKGTDGKSSFSDFNKASKTDEKFSKQNGLFWEKPELFANYRNTSSEREESPSPKPVSFKVYFNYYDITSAEQLHDDFTSLSLENSKMKLKKLFSKPSSQQGDQSTIAETSSKPTSPSVIRKPKLSLSSQDEEDKVEGNRSSIAAETSIKPKPSTSVIRQPKLNLASSQVDEDQVEGGNLNEKDDGRNVEKKSSRRRRHRRKFEPIGCRSYASGPYNSYDRMFDSGWHDNRFKPVSEMNNEQPNVRRRGNVRRKINSCIAGVQNPCFHRPRPIVIDGFNVAYEFGKFQTLNFDGVQSAVAFFVDRGHNNIKIFLPTLRLTRYPPKTLNIISKLTPLTVFLATTDPSHPSYTSGIIEEAASNGGVIVSNNGYFTLSRFSQQEIEERCMSFMFYGRKFLPYNMASLDKFLSFPDRDMQVPWF